jgi:hypothetical protein
MKTNRIAKGLVALSAALALTACGTSLGSIADVGATTSSGTTSSAVATTATDGSYTIHAQADDVDYDASTAKTIALGSGNVEITEPGTYILTGTLSNGQVIVNSSAEGKVRIVLSNASITNSSGAAIDVRAADEVVVVLAEGTSNSLTDGSGYDTSGEDAADAALFSMADLTIGGTGSLIVTGNTADGIASKDGLVILGGTITVKAADDGIRGKDYLVIQDGTLDVTSAQDGLKSTNETDAQYGDIVISGGTVTVNAGDDGAHAEGDLAITGGTVTIAKSSEGLEGHTITIAGGSTSVTSSDDGVNASSGTGSTSGGGGGGGGMADDGSSLLISGGTLTVNASGDGLDSNGSITISGGTTTVAGPTGNGNGSLDSNAGITYTGGTLIAAGSAGMAEAPDSGNYVQANVSAPAGATIEVRSGDTVIATYTTIKAVANVVVASDHIVSGQFYTVTVNGSTTATVTAGQATGGGMGGGPRG